MSFWSSGHIHGHRLFGSCRRRTLRPPLQPDGMKGLAVSLLCSLLPVSSAFIPATPSWSACATVNADSPTYKFGVGTCSSSGSVMLKSDVVEVGIHNLGSYGTNFRSPSSAKGAPVGYTSSTYNNGGN